MKFLTSLAILLGLSGSMAAVSAEVPKMPEHAVVVHFQYGSRDLSRLFELEDKIEDVVIKAKGGEYDGHEIAMNGSDGFLYLYGPDADKLFDAIEITLQNSLFMQGAEVKKRYGKLKPARKK